MTFDYIKNTAGHFVCQHKDCGKTFARQNTMYYHMKRHAGEFTYTCTECKKGFIQKSAFLHHQAAVHHDKLPIPPACSDPQDYNTNTNHEASDEIVNNVVTNEPIDNLITKPTVVTNNTIVNPYAGITYKCPCCDHSTRTKANALVHYARLHAEGWIPSYDKAKGCTHCAKTFSSIAAYLYHCTGCIPANKTHRAAISRMMESA